MKILSYLLLIVVSFVSCTSAQNTTHILIEDYEHKSGNILVDVRTAKEFSQGHLSQAINIDVKDNYFEQKMEQFDKNQPVYLYCRSGKRSLQAAQKLEKLGFKNIYNLEGGFLRWEQKRNLQNSEK